MDEVVITVARAIRSALRTTRNVWQSAGPLAPIVFKAALVASTVWYLQTSEYTFGSITLFIAVAIICYMQPVFKTFSLTTSLLLIIALSLLLTSRFTISLPVEMHANALGQLMFAIAFGFLFFVLLGIKNVVLVRRQQWYALLFIALLQGISLLFFTSIIGIHPWRNMLLLVLFTYLLLREYFTVQEHPRNRALVVITLTLTVIIAQLAWALSLLPLGFSKAASILTLVGIVLTGIIDRYIRGTLSGHFLRISFFLFVALTSVVFFSVRWIL